MLNHRTYIRFLYVSLVLLAIFSVTLVSVLLESKVYVYNTASISNTGTTTAPTPFPVSVDPTTGTIIETELAGVLPPEALVTKAEPASWLERIFAAFSERAWYQNLASPVSRIVVIWPGERKEEAAKAIGDVLRWDKEERTQFISLVTTAEPVLPEGTFYPDRYVTHRNATPEEVAAIITDRFEAEILSRYTPEVATKVPLTDALIIASLLEREASDFENMREIAGVIWNRLFIDMPLQLDATLQYASANRPGSSEWWPVPRPADKFITSPYNTYVNPGLPPAPIANPSAAAVVAALNPLPTDCLFYFHGPDGAYYCSITYEDHTKRLREVYQL